MIQVALCITTKAVTEYTDIKAVTESVYSVGAGVPRTVRVNKVNYKGHRNTMFTPKGPIRGIINDWFTHIL